MTSRGASGHGHAYDPDAIIGLKSFPGESSLSFPSPGSGSLKLYEEAGGHPEALKNEKKCQEVEILVSPSLLLGASCRKISEISTLKQ